ncbi:MAG: hypothetical protein CVU31_09825 [Betaproteobacteria bacterium HGW-Betaproteobacteria-4]|jgi:hypothetical protein|nr:MAG: hypothetical protein CVU31_09825 [Betaproteobacteria bacterium HGW-Betaproteobacteria-4]
MKNRIKFGLMLCASLAISACATLAGDPVDRADRKAKALAPRAPQTSFDEAQAKAALKPGNVEIKSVLVSCYGRAIGCMQGSIPVVDTNVYLYPYTPYLEEYLAMQKKLNADIKRHRDYSSVKITISPKLTEYRRTARSDEFGRYSFKNVKPGKYYIASARVTGYRTVVKHYYDEFGYDHPRQEQVPADLEYASIVDITETSGVHKFESKVEIVR